MTDKDKKQEEKNEEVKDQAQAEPEQEIEEKDPVQELKDQVNDLEDQNIRYQAEIQNIQQRNAREIASIRKYDGQKLATAVIPVVDNLERALAVEDGDDEVALQIKKGVEITLKTLRQALKDNGVEECGKVGDLFDPTRMQGIQSVAADEAEDVESDHVARVLQKGYTLHDRVIRPAMVAVVQ
ncbi:nucleotide exchange factor GrpE [Eupransor demetentiae]|uniref:Protein GrpE n=1 Tax=Eupransor demetentiae TaxID=3109584 RepID=A0ABP0EP28_9LACO|nr:Molecular chaperone GrpE (heat shock protein HSP-70) (GrpE) [Lactobacillaceae bacterium LMG 33000]